MSATEQDRQKSSPSPQSADARVRRTCRLLHDAFGRLLREKPYEAIGIKEILARAQVARSTFYAHFRDKDELLLCAVNDIIESQRAFVPAATMTPADRVLRFSLPIFEHIEPHRADTTAIRAMTAGHRAVHARLARIIEGFVERELGRTVLGWHAWPAALVARQVASTFVVVFEWWLTSAPELSARETNHVFRNLAAPAMA
jgi:AcrR family transcriptional regulator